MKVIIHWNFQKVKLVEQFLNDLKIIKKKKNQLAKQIYTHKYNF